MKAVVPIRKAKEPLIVFSLVMVITVVHSAFLFMNLLFLLLL